MEGTNAVQRLQLELMRCASFNSFDGDRVVDDLIANRDLWSAALMTRSDLIPLRDLPEGFWNVDTLYILPQDGQAEALERLAHGWIADSVYWLEGDKADAELGGTGQSDPRVLVVWWD